MTAMQNPSTEKHLPWCASHNPDFDRPLCESQAFGYAGVGADGGPSGFLYASRYADADDNDEGEIYLKAAGFGEVMPFTREQINYLHWALHTDVYGLQEAMRQVLIYTKSTTKKGTP